MKEKWQNLLSGKVSSVGLMMIELMKLLTLQNRSLFLQIKHYHFVLHFYSRRLFMGIKQCGIVVVRSIEITNRA